MPSHRLPIFSHAELAQLCCTGRFDATQRAALPTQHAELDAALPGGGLPVGAVTEIMTPTAGIGELKVVVFALAKLTQAHRHIAFVQPPYLPYPPALAQHGLRMDHVIAIHASPIDALWASEQLLRCSALGAVLLWPPTIDDKSVRRLQLAAEAGGSTAILYRPVSAARFTSPAALRLLLHADTPLRIELKKCRGGRAARSVRCAVDNPIDAQLKRA